MNFKQTFVVVAGTLFLIFVVIGGIVLFQYTKHQINNELVAVSVKHVENNVECAIATGPDGTAISCWKE